MVTYSRNRPELLLEGTRNYLCGNSLKRAAMTTGGGVLNYKFNMYGSVTVLVRRHCR